MKQTTDFSDNVNAEQHRDKTDKVKTLSSEPNKLSSLAVIIAALSGYVMPSLPAHAAFNIPTDSTPSPLCISGQPGCATPFTAKMLMFDEVVTPPESYAMPIISAGAKGVMTNTQQ
jgi:hypothetical protein